MSGDGPAKAPSVEGNRLRIPADDISGNGPQTTLTGQVRPFKKVGRPSGLADKLLF